MPSTDALLVSLHGEGKAEAVDEQLKKLGKDEIIKLIDGRVLSGKGDPVALIGAILYGCPESDTGHQIRLKVFKHCLRVLQGGDLGSRISTQLVGLLMLEADGLKVSHLAEIAELYLDRIKRGIGTSSKALELFPKILSALAVQENVEYKEKSMSGMEYKSHILNSLCSGKWDPSCVIHLASMFKDVSMTNDELGFVIDRIIRMFGEVDLQELPPLVFQLLVIAAKGHKQMVLEGLRNFFNEQDKIHKSQEVQSESMELSESVAPTEQLRQVEGTVILHFTFAMKLDQDLGREFIKTLKANQQSNPAEILAPFSLAMALSVAKMHRFKEQVFEVLKTSILKCYKDAERRLESGWVRDMVVETSNVAQKILDTVRNSVHGWDHVTQGLVELGFILMDSFGPRAAFGRTTDPPASKRSPTQKACQLGVDVLLETFKVHELVRTEILEHVLNRIITKATAPVSHFLARETKAIVHQQQPFLHRSPLAQTWTNQPKNQPSYGRPYQQGYSQQGYSNRRPQRGNQNRRGDLRFSSLCDQLTEADAMMRYVYLLKSMVKCMPQFFLESMGKVRESLDYLSYLPQTSAEGLMRALLPLAKISMTLKDGLIIILRKAMFSRQLEARKVSATGFLLLLQQFKVIGGLPISASQASGSSQFSLSQVQVDVHRPHNAATNESLCLEILGNLRRCMNQQADVRLTLYEGLHEVLCRNKNLKSPVISMLYSQLKQYYENNAEVQPPLKLEPCTLAQGEKILLSEPLGHLLFCLTRCVITAKESNESSSEDDGMDEDIDLSDAEDLLDSLVKRMIIVDLEDFELDKAADFSLNTGVGMRNNLFATLVAQVYEVLMEYIYTTGQYSDLSCQRIQNLFQKYQKVGEAVSGGKAGGGASTKKSPKSLLSIRCVSEILHGIFCDEMPDHQEGLEILRSDTPLQRYVVGVSIQRLQQISDKGVCDGPEGGNKEQLFQYITNIARALHHKYVSITQGNAEIDSDRRKQLSYLCLDGFSLAITVITNHYNDSINEFLKKIDSSPDNANLERHEIVHKQIKAFQRMVMNYFTADEDDRSAKEAVSLLQVVGHLTSALPPFCQEFNQIQNWIQTLCTEQTVDDLAVVKCLLQLLFKITNQLRSCVIVCRDLSQDIHSQLGDIDQEVEVEDRVNFSMVTRRTAAPSVFLALLHQYDRDIDDTNWVINSMTGQTSDEITEITQAENQEKYICTRLGQMINGFHELVQSAIPVGPCMDGIVKTITLLYSSLTLLVKFYLGLYRKGPGHLSPRFEKLVKLSGNNLTQFVYALITYIQASQMEHLQQATEKSKKKTKKVSAAVAIANKAKVLKETKSIPSLIFAIEQYEKFLIQLTKKSKVNLMETMKVSTSRDFRINVAGLEQAMDEEGSSEEEEEEEEEDEDNATQGASQHEANKQASSEEETEEQENKAPSGKKREKKTAEESAPPAKKSLLGTKKKPLKTTK